MHRLKAIGLRPVVVGIILASVSLVYSVSFVSLIFSGPLEPLRSVGLVYALCGSIIFALAGALSGSIRGTWWGNQTIPAVILALAASSLALGRGWEDQDTLYASVLLMIVLSTTVSGVVLLAIGHAGLASLVRFIPHPVVGGFLAATGCYLVLRAAALATGVLELEMLLSAGHIWHWMPFVGAGLIITALTRALPALQVIAFAILLYLTGFYAYLWWSGSGIDGARAAGLLLDAGKTSGTVVAALDPGRFSNADPAVLLEVLPAIATVAGLAVLGTLMNVSGIELISGRNADLDKDFRYAGGANLLAALFNGLPGYHSASMMQLTKGLIDRPSVMASLVGSVILASILAFGTTAVGLLPVGVLAMMLSYVGFDLLWRWLVEEARRMPRGDFAIVLLILTVTLLFDLAVAIAAGLLTATVLFAIAYSRVDVVRSIASGRQRLSPTERSEPDIERIVARGGETVIFDLQGFLFFGTSEHLYGRMAEEIRRSPGTLRRAIVDFRRVVGMDSSTAQMFRKIARTGYDHGVTLVLCDLRPDDMARLAQADVFEFAESCPSLTDALRAVETEILEGGCEAMADEMPVGAVEASFRRIEGLLHEKGLDRVAVPAGEVLFRYGDPSESLVFLEKGRLAAEVPAADGSPREVASFLPGAIVGEIGFYAGSARTATVRAVTDCTICLIEQNQIAALVAANPTDVAEFHRALAALLARRLSRTTALVIAIDR